MDCTDRAFLLRLEALSCPLLPALSTSKPLDQQKLISWLEDAHIRRLPVAERAALRQRTFLPALQAYLRQLGLPPPAPSDLRPTTRRLVDAALRLHYADAADELSAPPDPWDGRCVPAVPGATQHADVCAAVTELLAALQVRGTPPDAAEGARVAACAAEAWVAAGGDEDGMDDTEGALLDALPLGFVTGDDAVDQFAKVARVLQVRQLRDLQDAVNMAVADMQKVTADPKTDSALGRVGR